MLGSLFLMTAPDWSLPATQVCKVLLVVGVAIAPDWNSLTTEVMKQGAWDCGIRMEQLHWS